MREFLIHWSLRATFPAAPSPPSWHVAPSPPLYPTGHEPKLYNGLYVINAHTREAVKMVLARKINKRLVAEINLVASASGFAIPTVIMSSSESAVLGIVSDQVSRVDPSVLHSILADGHIPMIAFVAAD